MMIFFSKIHNKYSLIIVFFGGCVLTLSIMAFVFSVLSRKRNISRPRSIGETEGQKVSRISANEGRQVYLNQQRTYNKTQVYNNYTDNIGYTNSNINEKNDNGWTPLHIAASKGNINLIKGLLKNKANLTDVNNEGQTALHIAILNKKCAAAKVLLSEDNLEIPDNQGNTPLHLCALTGAKDLAEAILNKNVAINIDAVNNEGMTPLHLAASKGKSHIIKLLLNTRADPNIKDNDGNIALHSSIHNEHNYIDLLKAPQNVHVPRQEASNYQPISPSKQQHPNLEKAIEHYSKGKIAYDEKDYKSAITFFRQAKPIYRNLLETENKTEATKKLKKIKELKEHAKNHLRVV